jgi:hypothetical protein
MSRLNDNNLLKKKDFRKILISIHSDYLSEKELREMLLLSIENKGINHFVTKLLINELSEA